MRERAGLLPSWFCCPLEAGCGARKATEEISPVNHLLTAVFYEHRRQSGRQTWNGSYKIVFVSGRTNSGVPADVWRVTRSNTGSQQSASFWEKWPRSFLRLLKLLAGNAQVRKLRPSAGRARKGDHTTVISRRSSGAKMALGMRAWTPRTMSTTCVTRKLAAMLQSA